MTTPLGGAEALGEVSRAKIGQQEFKSNYAQVLVNNGTLATTGIISKPMGYPTFLDIVVHPTVTATLQVWVSQDGVQFFHDTTLDIAMTAATDKTVRINSGWPYIQFIPSVAQTAGFWLILTAKY